MKYIINSFISIITIFCISGFTSSTIDTSVSKWERLGSRTVDFKLDKDVIHVGAKDGSFAKLKLAVTRGDLNMHKMRIEYHNGQVENINLKHNFSKRSSSRVIDIDGRKRIIKNIILWYDTKNRSKKKALITVFGR